MKYSEHVRECEEKLGSGWNCVHLWLDYYSNRYQGWKGHRCHRHHREGVEIIRKLWGDQAAEAAELHIKSDFESDHVMDSEEVHKLYHVKDNVKEIE